jgi:hypothetical protein
MWGNHQWATAMWGADLAAIFAMATPCRLTVVEEEIRFFDVEAEMRYFAVPPVVRTGTVTGESRRLRVSRETRTSKPTCRTN